MWQKYSTLRTPQIFRHAQYEEIMVLLTMLPKYTWTNFRLLCTGIKKLFRLISHQLLQSSTNCTTVCIEKQSTCKSCKMQKNIKLSSKNISGDLISTCYNSLTQCSVCTNLPLCLREGGTLNSSCALGSKDIGHEKQCKSNI